jgi:hypothetical protein
MGQGGGRAPPQAASGGGLATPLPNFFFFSLKKNVYLFIFLINLYYFIKMCMSVPRVANKMATRGADVVFDGIY